MSQAWLSLASPHGPLCCCAALLGLAACQADEPAALAGGDAALDAGGGAPDAANDANDHDAANDAVLDEDESRDLFVADQLLDVELELPADDWDVLRAQGRSAPGLFSGCADPNFEYDYVRANVSIDGERLEDVDVRKKGFLGSLSTLRPSLKINFGRQRDDDRTFHGTKRITLNNDRQDPSHLRQCMFYGFATQVGLAAPRCAHATVAVNGSDLGVYSHVEAIKKPFLARHFDSDGGNLYEGQAADFTEGLKSRFQRKTNEDDPDRSDLDVVVEALQAPDDELLSAASQVFDLDEYITFWATEVLAGHWDGMTGDQNNYYVYHDPTDGRFHPIPWGADAAFTARHAFLPPDHPRSVWAGNLLSSRLYAIDEGRQLYHQELRRLLDEHWDEDALIAEARRIAALTDAPTDAVEEVVEFIEGRRAVIVEELSLNDGSGPDYPYGLQFEARGCTPARETRGEFELTWSDAGNAMQAYQPLGDHALSYSFPLSDEGSLELERAGILQAAYVDAEPTDGRSDVVRLGFVGNDSEGRQIVVQFLVPQPLYRPGTIPFHGLETWGYLVDLTDGDTEFRLIGAIGEGSLTLETAPMQPGELVTGSWSGLIAPFTPGL